MTDQINQTETAKNSDSLLWEQQTIKDLLLENLTEQRRKRRWGIFFKLVGFTYAIVVTLIFFVDNWQFNKETGREHTAVIEILGEINKDQAANAQDLNRSLKLAFEHKKTKGVVLRINSPGGSPVQARQVYNNINLLKAKYPNIKLYAAIEDLGTSAAYLIASAADQIYADETSLVGSIGVIINGFGFVDTLNKLGIERRIYAAGKNKAMLDPFSPKNPEDEQFIEQQLKLTHKLFINNVIQRRPQLAEHPEDLELFSGKFWIGQSAKELGLIDEFGDVQYIADQVIKASELKNFTVQPNLVDRFSSKFKVMLSNFKFL